jgi:hypothetical protein
MHEYMNTRPGMKQLWPVIRCVPVFNGRTENIRGSFSQNRLGFEPGTSGQRSKGLSYRVLGTNQCSQVNQLVLRCDAVT